MFPGDRSRLRELLTAGLIDSFGLAFGWTVFNLIAVAGGGLAAAGLYNAAMLVGVVLSAPATTWLARRVPGRTLLTGTAAIEVVLRVGTLVGLLAGWSSTIVAAGVIVMNVAAWAGYAGMRAEVAAVDIRPAAMTRYATAIAAVEAAGAITAALLPIGGGDAGSLSAGSSGSPHRTLLIGAIVLYAASLIPQFTSARDARVPSARQARADAAAGRHNAAGMAKPFTMMAARLADRPPSSWAPGHRRGQGRRRGRSHHRRDVDLGTGLRTGLRTGLLRGAHDGLPRPLGALLGGAIIMAVASGPTRLSIALSAQLYGHRSVVVAAAAFTGGCLLASFSVDLAPRLRLPTTLSWPLWGVGMVIGWAAAPWNLMGLVVAQVLSGLSLTTFEGAMDAQVASQAREGEITTALAWSASVRAMGSALAVRLLPLMAAAPAIGILSTAAAAFLGAAAILGLVASAAIRRATGVGSPNVQLTGQQLDGQQLTGQQLSSQQLSSQQLSG